MNKVQGFESVEQFLDNWKKEAFEWYMDQDAKLEAEKEARKANPSEAEKMYQYFWHSNNDEYEVREAKAIEFLNANYERHPEKPNCWKIPKRKYHSCDSNYAYQFSIHNALVSIANYENWLFREKWSHVYSIYEHVGGKYKSYAEYVEALLQKEYERKYEKLASDCYKITGAIQKADLRVNYASKNIEGFIHGEIGNAELWSTLSGGEVQCLHLRFYCHKR